MIQIRERKKLSYALLATAVLLLLSFVTLFAFKDMAGAVTTVINVTTTADEDSHPGVGAGCSLYEAVIAANTAAAYGGCTAGDVTGPNIVTLPAGTYARDMVDGPLADVVEYPDGILLELDGTSLAGAGMDQTIIDGYSISLSGDQIATLSGVSLTAGVSYSHPSFVSIAGSNKTVSDVSVANAGMIPADITFQTEAEQVIENITIEDSEIRATTFATNPSSTMSCGGSGTCQDITINNVDISSNFSTTVNLSGDDVTFTNSSINVVGCSGSINLTLGDNSTVNNASLGSTDCANTVSVNLGTSTHPVNNVVINGNNAIVDFDSPEVDGLTIDATSTVTVDNVYDGSTFSNVDINGADVSVGVSGGMMASVIDTVSVIGTGSVNFENQKDNSQITDVYFESLYEESSYPDVSLTGSNLVVDGLEVITDVSSHGEVDIYGESATISDVNLVNARFSFTEQGTYEIENFSINAPDYLEAVYSYDGGDLTLRNGYIYDGRGGISAESYSNSPGYKLTVENVLFENLAVGDGSPGAIYAMGVEEVVVRNVTIIDTEVDNLAPIVINGGSNHELVNVTIADSNAGIAVLDGPSVIGTTNVAINNVTIRNNVSYTPRELPDETALFISNENANVTVTNSTLSGLSDHTACFADAFISLEVSNSFSNDALCVDEGFTLLTDAGLATALADNDSEAADIGFNGSYGVLKTLALESDSALIGAGDAGTCEVTDARGFERDLDAGCDVGAFQYSIVIPIPDPDPDPDPTPDPDDEETGGGDPTVPGNSSGTPVGNNTGTGGQSPNTDSDLAIDDTTTEEDLNIPTTNEDDETGDDDLGGTSGDDDNGKEADETNDAGAVIGWIIGGTIFVGVASWSIWSLIRRFGGTGSTSGF